jgi:hypothetical protein
MLNSLLAGFISVMVSWAQPYATRNNSALTIAETTCLAETIYFESRGEGSEGMTSIAYVVLNRTVARNKNICATVHEPSQFSYYTPHHQRPIRETDLWIQSIAIGVFAQLGMIKNPIGNATSFNTASMQSWIRSDHMVMTKKINHHYFYTESGYVHADPLVPAEDRFASVIPCKACTPATVSIQLLDTLRLTQMHDISQINVSTFDWGPPLRGSKIVGRVTPKSVTLLVHEKSHRHGVAHRSYAHATRASPAKTEIGLDRTACSHC